MRIVPAARPVRSATSLMARPRTCDVRRPCARGWACNEAGAPQRGRRWSPPCHHAARAPGRRHRSARMRLLNRRHERQVANAVIADPEEHTVMDEQGAVRSIQAANVDMPESELDAIWTPTHLERLARTYWKYLSRVSLGLIRVRYTEDERAVVLLGRPLVLLRFHAPEYELSGERGIVRWRIKDGVLVAQRDRGHLEIDVRRCPAG